TADDWSVAKYEINAEAEKRLWRKLDIKVILVLWFWYMHAFLDRTSDGNAEIQGMKIDRAMRGNDYNITLFMFFVPYILFEILSSIG
ncbi:hypothetical protein M433DRAFT_62037, partial [Acidomyces richmondensis BFW]